MAARESLICYLIAAIGSILILQGQLATAVPLGLDSASRLAIRICAKQTSSGSLTSAESWSVTRRIQLPGAKNPQDEQHRVEDNSMNPASNNIAPSRAIRRSLASDGRQDAAAAAAAAAEHFTRQPVHRRALKLVGENGIVTAIFVLAIFLAFVVAVGIASVVVCGPDWKRCLSRSAMWAKVAQEDEAGAR
ncbi:hypothetical protein VTG60DRAFT_4452 [Thermothelomyces hinnuleus]